MKKLTWLLSAVALVALGVAVGIAWQSRHERAALSPSERATGAAPTTASPPATASDSRIARAPEPSPSAGAAAPASDGASAGDTLRIPGVVQPNAYRQVVVTPLVSGRVTRVFVALGDGVRQGQPLAEIYSPELADAQTNYLSMRAELEAAHQRLRRTEQLLEAGATSKQELEQVAAEHTRHATGVEGARARLALLGLTTSQIEALTAASQITATVTVPAPLDGVVLARHANPGLVVNTATDLFTVADLSTVWVIGSVYERDLARVRVGSRVTLTSPALPDARLDGTVSYIDPQIASDTRTAQVRVPMANRDGRLRLAMYVDMTIAASDRDAVRAARVEITGHGFTPDRISARAGERLDLTFVRRTDQTCATEIVIPSLETRRALPLNTPVTITVPPQHQGEWAFTCGMNMLRGTVVVQ